MSKVILFILIAGFISLASCTGQRPAEIKSPQTFKPEIKSSCTDLVIDGKILTKRNLVNVFNCSRWDKKYPQLNKSLIELQESQIETLLSPFNSSFLEKKSQRNKLIQVLSQFESENGIHEIGKLLEKLIANETIFKPLSRLLSDTKIQAEQKSKLLGFFSTTKSFSVKDLESWERIFHQINKSQIDLNNLLQITGTQKNQSRLLTFIDELTLKMKEEDWEEVSRILYDDEKKNSIISDWSEASLNGHPEILIKILTNPSFGKNLRKLNETINEGVACKNNAHVGAFKINVAGELNQVVESLKRDDKQGLEKTLLHGLVKYIAFQEFCQEKKEPQGIVAFKNVLNYAMSILDSDADYNFIRELHFIFQESPLKFLSFLSTESFEALRAQLTDLDQDKVSIKFAEVFFQIVSSLKTEDLIFMSKHLRSASLDQNGDLSLLRLFSFYWQNLSQKEKIEILNLLTIVLDEDVSIEVGIKFIRELLLAFPDFSIHFETVLKDESYQNSLQHFLNAIKNKSAQAELANFLSEDGLFEMIRVLTQDQERKKTRVTAKAEAKPSDMNFFENHDSMKESQTKICFNELSEAYEKDSSYYPIVNELPLACKVTLGKAGFVGQIYLWMNQAHSDFSLNLGIQDFHTSQSIWSPGMLHFIFTAALEANLNLRSSNGREGIENNIEEIHRTLTDSKWLESFHQFSLIFKTVNGQIDFESRLANYVELKKDLDLKKNAQDFFKVFSPVTAQFIIKKIGNCHDLNRNWGANPCFDKTQPEEDFLELLRLLKRKNQAGDSLIKELLSWLHPNGGVIVLNDKNQKQKFQTNLDEVVRFLFDLSSDKTNKKFLFSKDGKYSEEIGTTIDRLEILIRDIGFLNNYYGAYFKNKVATASDYKKEIKDSEKLLYLMQKSGPLLRAGGVFPTSTKDKLKNIRATYSSLAEVANDYPQNNGQSKNYSNFIQGLLSTIQKSSKWETQNFNPYRMPDVFSVEGHNGIFLNRVVQLSGLRHLSNNLRNATDNSRGFIDSKNFKLVNQNLISRHNLQELQFNLQQFLDKYLDSDRNELNLFFHDLFYFTSSLTSDERLKLVEISSKIFILFSSPEFESTELKYFASMFESFIANWPEIRPYLYSLKLDSKIFEIFNQFLDQLLSSPREFSSLLKELSFFITTTEMDKLLKDDFFLNHAKNLFESLLKMKTLETDLNWFETFQKILAQEDISFTPFIHWIQNSRLGNSKNEKLTFSVLITYLGEKENNSYRFKKMMDELFLIHRSQLKDFMQKTFIQMNLETD